ncbi:MAG: pilus assembly protein N-terminal domain-containing protein [Pseudomonadota bacterium]|nr:pilus assembly protein N-terminal domain-containing protein [Pseudomonadota bacterium]
MIASVLRILIASGVFLAASIAGAVDSPGPVVQPSGPAPVELTLEVGQAHLIEAPGIRRIAVGNGKSIQATALDRRQVLVLPEAPGQSSLHLWPRRGPPLAYRIRVVSAETGRMLAGVKALLGEEGNLRVGLVGERIVIEGERPSVAQAARLQTLVETYPSLVNMVGEAGRERMIAMDVRMVEIKRSALENIGIRWDPGANGPSFGVVGDLHRGSAFDPGGAAAGVGLETGSGIAPFSALFGIATSIRSMINLLEQSGDAVVLAEPRLSCRSGATARFVAGGELPIPQAGNLGAIDVQFKEYGVKFDISPVAGSDGLIRAKVATEISSIDFDVHVKDVPGLLKRRAETEVRLREGETLIIAGLLRQDASGSIDKVPGLGDVPVLGALFRSRMYREQQTDLVVFVTPRFVEDPALEAQARRETLDSRMAAVRAMLARETATDNSSGTSGQDHADALD